MNKLDEYVTDKLYESVYLLQLITGELLLLVYYSKNELGIVTYFPLQVNEDVFETFCPYAKDRRFEFNIMNVVYIKKASRKAADKLFERVMTENIEEFRKFILMFSEQVVEDPQEERVLH